MRESFFLNETSSLTPGKSLSEILEKLFCDDPSAGIERDLHFRNLLVDFLHKVNHEIHQFVLVHLAKREVNVVVEKAIVPENMRLRFRIVLICGRFHHCVKATAQCGPYKTNPT